jgi:membrane-associated protease RseP (regulator of RpoE activity)
MKTSSTYFTHSSSRYPQEEKLLYRKEGTMKSTVLFEMLSVLSGLLFWGGASVADQSAEPSLKQEGMQLPKGVIGVSLDVSAERIGDPAILYVAMVNPEGPAHRAGLAHGDEIQAVDETPVAGKTYEQVVKMIRGEPGTTVKLTVKGERGAREVSVTRVAADRLPMGPKGSHGGQAR